MRVTAIARGQWHRALAVVALGGCAWMLVEAGRLVALSTEPSEVEEAVRIVGDVLAAPAVEAAGCFPSFDYSGRAEASLSCNGCAAKVVEAVPAHLFHALAPKAVRKHAPISKVQARFGPPAVLNAAADHGKIDLVLARSEEDEHVRIVRFELFRREEGGSRGEEPFAVLEPGADGRAVFADLKVRPKTRYAYGARAVGVPDAPRGDGGAAEPKKQKMVRPEGVEDVAVGDVTGWRTPFSAEVWARVPGDVELELVGIVGEPPDWSARTRVRQWNAGFNAWDEATFTIAEGEAIGGREIIRRPARQEWVDVDSGHVLERIELVKERRRIGAMVVEVAVPRATARETSTGEQYPILPKRCAREARKGRPETVERRPVEIPRAPDGSLGTAGDSDPPRDSCVLADDSRAR